MAKFTLTGAQVLIAGNDVSAHVKQITINYSIKPEDATGMGDLTTHDIPGLFNYSFDFDLQQDFAAANIDAILFPLLGTAVTVEVRPAAGARSATNPAYFSAAALFTDYPPIGGQVGGVAMAKIKFVPTNAAGAANVAPLQRLTA